MIFLAALRDFFRDPLQFLMWGVAILALHPPYIIYRCILRRGSAGVSALLMARCGPAMAIIRRNDVRAEMASKSTKKVRCVKYR